jgi:aldose 1-epimerase
MTDSALETVTLRDPDAALEATFLPAAGMLCCSLRHRGQELLAQNNGTAAYVERGKLMGIPLLYPWANRLADFGYQLNGRTIYVPHDPTRVALDSHGLPIHGVIGGRQKWKLTSARGPNARGPALRRLTARLSWTELAPELFEVFPFRHEVTYAASLADGRLELELTVDACGTDPVPLAFGYHPYLSLTGVAREDWTVELPAMRRLELDQKQIPIGPAERLRARRFQLAALAFDDGFDEVPDAARFVVTAGSRRIELQFLEGYPYAQVFTPSNAQFICFEPMVAPANALRSGIGLRVLSPGETFRARFSLRVSCQPS